MFIFLLIYIIGIIATLWLGYHTLDRGTEISLCDFTLFILVCVFSWIAFIGVIIIEYGDMTVFKKK